LEDSRQTRSGLGKAGRVLVARLEPGSDLMPSLRTLAQRANIRTGVILSGVASFEKATIRNVGRRPEQYPITDQQRIFTPKEEPIELLALSGNISQKDGEVFVHAHVTISSGLDDGRAYGGHLVDGCIVLTTAELVIMELTGLAMERVHDPVTRALELYPGSC
jgi:uncharacterized protein